MKQVISFVSVTAAVALILAGCSSGGGSDSKSGNSSNGGASPVPVAAQTVETVASYSVSDIEKSGAATPWAEADIAGATDTIMDDPLVATAMETFMGMYEGSAGARATAVSLEDVIDDAVAGFMELPKTKSVEKSYDLSGQKLTDYFTATTLKSSVKTTVLTTDGKDLVMDGDEDSNFLSGSGTMTLKADIDAVKSEIPKDSNVKDVKIKVNLAAAASLGSFVNTYGERETKDLSFSYAANVSFAAAYVNEDGAGGKLVIKVSATKPTTTLDTSYDGDDETYEKNIIMPSDVSISITAYDDAGKTIVTKNFTKYQDFEDYINQY